MPGPSRHRLPPLVVMTALVAWSATGRAAEEHPLAPADTSSPRATLESFCSSVDTIYADLKGSPARTTPLGLRGRN